MEMQKDQSRHQSGIEALQSVRLELTNIASVMIRAEKDMARYAEVDTLWSAVIGGLLIGVEHGVGLIVQLLDTRLAQITSEGNTEHGSPDPQA